MAQPTVTTTGATPAAGQATFPPFARETFVPQLLWFAITFGLLYYLMSKIALPRIATILESRSNRIAADLAEAEALKTQSEAAGAAYQKSLADARNNAKAIAQATRDKLAAESEARRKVLEAQLADKIASSEELIRSSTAQAMSNVHEIAADTATAIVERLTGRAPDRSAVEAALNRTLAR